MAVDGTSPHVPDDETVTWRYPKRKGDKLEFGYPLLRLLVLIECGTRAVLAAAFAQHRAEAARGEAAASVFGPGCFGVAVEGVQDPPRPDAGRRPA